MIELLGAVAALAFVVWAARRLFSPRAPRAPDAIDRDELEAAEQAVRDADSTCDRDTDADWGPGAPRR